MSESLQIKKWVPDPSEIYIDSMPLGKYPPSKKDDKYLCAITFTVEEIMKFPRKQQIEIFTKVLETLEMVAKTQKTTFKECYALRHTDKNGHQLISFYTYLPKKFSFPK